MAASLSYSWESGSAQSEWFTDTKYDGAVKIANTQIAYGNFKFILRQMRGRDAFYDFAYFFALKAISYWRLAMANGDKQRIVAKGNIEISNSV